MRSTPFIASELYPQLGIGAAVLVALFAFLAYRTVKSPALAPTMRPEAYAMLEKFELDEVLVLLDLVSAMAGYGPTVVHDQFRVAAEKQMGQEVYLRFVRAFAVVAQLPKSAVMSQRTIIELSNYPEEFLLKDESLLIFLIANAQFILDFYLQFSADRDLTDGLPRFTDMIDDLDELVELHDRFYSDVPSVSPSCTLDLIPSVQR